MYFRCNFFLFEYVFFETQVLDIIKHNEMCYTSTSMHYFFSLFFTHLMNSFLSSYNFNILFQRHESFFLSLYVDFSSFFLFLIYRDQLNVLLMKINNCCLKMTEIHPVFTIENLETFIKANHWTFSFENNKSLTRLCLQKQLILVNKIFQWLCSILGRNFMWDIQWYSSNV